jgi:site-specific recombinase XerD
MTPWRQRLIHDLQLRNYSPRTVECYVGAVAHFARHFGRSPEHLGAEHTRAYQLHLLGQKASWSRFNQAVCALRFLYGVTRQRPDTVPLIPYGKRPKTLPCVLSRDEVRRLFACVNLPWFLLLLQLTYACGLRLGEVVRLRLTDSDSARLVIHIRCAKGNNDRLVPLSAALLGLLREYWRPYRPREWLFPSRRHGQHLNLGSVQRLFRRFLTASGITKKARRHTLRHRYATHLLEAGCDLACLQKLLGHNQLSTTWRYIHIGQAHWPRVASPLDTLLASPPAQQTQACATPPWMSEPSCEATPPVSQQQSPP